MEKLISIEDGKITKMDLVVLTTNCGWVCINESFIIELQEHQRVF